MKMAEPTDTAEVYKIMGTINFLGRYISYLSSVLHPTTDLLGRYISHLSLTSWVGTSHTSH